MLRDVDVLPLRMQSLGLAAQIADDPLKIAEHSLAVQGQNLTAACWALGLRSGRTAEVVQQGFNNKQLVRGWPMRGTLHVMPASAAGWLQGLEWELSKTRWAGWLKRTGLPPTLMLRAEEVAATALANQQALTRTELLDQIVQQYPQVEPQRRLVLLLLVLSGLVILGPIKEGEQLCVWAPDWLPPTRNLSLDESLAELVVAFVRSHGPVTEADLVRWSSRGVREIRHGLSVAGDRVVKIDGESGQPWLLTPESADQTIGADWLGIRLLPSFDEHILGYKDRSHQLEPAHEETVCPGRNGMFKATVVADGRVVGTWSSPGPASLASLPASRAVSIALTPFRGSKTRLKKSKELSAATTAYAKYLGRSATAVTFQVEKQSHQSESNR